MTLTRGLAIAGLVVTAAVLGWIVRVGLLRWHGAASPDIVIASPSAPPSQGRKIKAQLFYVSDDGAQLMNVERDVPYSESTAEQAKAIINVQIAASGDDTVSAVPAGTKLRALFVTPQGEAYVDFSPEISTGHPGGSRAELLTVYTIVDALTVNLPAIKAVHLLVDGKDVETLAGHVDLRGPLAKNTSWMAEQ